MTAGNREPTTKRRLLACSAGGLLGALLSVAFPPIDLPWLGLPALAMLLALTLGAPQLPGTWLGLGAGLAWFGIYLRWLGVLGWYALVGAVVVEALFLAAFFAIAPRILRQRSLPAALAAGGLWVMLENLRGAIPFGGFPWATLGSALHELPGPRRLASVVGTSGLSALIVIACCLLIFAIFESRILHPTRRRVLVPVLALATLVAVAAFMPATVGRSKRSLRVAIVQAGIERPVFSPPDPQQVLDRHVALTRTLARGSVDLVLWGEGVIETADAGELLGGLSRQIGAPIAAGAVEEVPSGGWLNLVVASDGNRVLGRYAKQHPVPFGEYVPLRPLLGNIPILANEIPEDMKRGTEPALFDYGSVVATPVISFESTYAGIVRRAVRQGAELLQVHTNNSTFGRGPASPQHLSLDQMRAAEMGVPVVRSAITGISAVIDAQGKVLARTKIFETGVLRSRVQLSSGSTPFRRFGELLFSLPLQLWAVVYLLKMNLPFGAGRRPKGVSATAE